MLEFQLAENLGMTVQQLRQNITAGELTQWVAFFRVRAAQNDQQAAKAKAQAEMEQRANAQR